MEYYNENQNSQTLYQEDFNKSNGYEQEQKIDQFTFQQIEMFLQQRVIN